MTSRYRFRELTLALALALGGCAAKSSDGNSAGSGNSSAAAGNGSNTGGNIGIGGAIVTDPPVDAHRCSDLSKLSCRKVDCPADSSPSTTSVSGVVYDPGGRVPLYNAVVYVVQDPETDLPTLSERAACEKCAAHFPQDPVLAMALTDAKGRFRVTDMPTGEDVKLVIQLGKWRRVIDLPKIEPCTDTQLDADSTRLPRNSTEGHLPKIAVTTGASDALECLLKKIGIDPDEFTPDTDDGRVNLFAGFEAATNMISRGQSVELTSAQELWADSDRMLDYDMVLMSCEGDDNLWNSPDDDEPPPPGWERPVDMHLEVRKYADMGGRIFGSHWHHRWINSDNVTPENPYHDVANFSRSAKDIGEVTVSIDNTFPKGAAFEQWLHNVGASPTPGLLDLVMAEHSVDSVVPGVAQRWIYGTDPGGEVGENRVPEMVQYFSFTTPVGAPECGRMVFSDVHVSFGGGDYRAVPFPDRCAASPGDELSPQEKALEFMLFDLSSCIQKETDEVPMPVTVVK